MKHLRLYLHACLMLLFTILVLGFICPWLISADDDFLPVIGVLVLLTVPPVGAYFFWHTYKTIRGMINEENDKNDGVRRTTRAR